ncbi:acylphosphatase [Mycoplasmatota bacterium]|nr:acylphosphatase [Mycoplasmatota bacterium]
MKRYVLKIYGVDQRDSFSQLIYQQAIKNQLKGFVKICSGYVLLDCEGDKKNICSFLIEVIKKPMLLVKIEKVKAFLLVPYHYTKFTMIDRKKNK